MQFDWWAPGQKLRRLSFRTFGDVNEFLTRAKTEQPEKYFLLFGLDVDGNEFPDGHVLPEFCQLSDTHMRNVFTRRHAAGPLVSFYGLPVEEWRNSMGLELFLDYLQPLRPYLFDADTDSGMSDPNSSATDSDSD